MKKIILIVAILCLLLSNKSKAEYDLIHFTDYKIGDEVPIKINSPYTFIVFTSENECFTCWMSLKNIITAFEHFKDMVDIKIFIPNGNQDEADRIKNKLGIKQDVIADPFSLYKSQFKVKIHPYYFILDSLGRIIQMDKCGGIYSNMDNVIQEMINYKKNHSKKANISEYLYLVKEIELTVKDKKYPTDHLSNITYDTNKQNFVVLNRMDYTIDIFDTNGKLSTQYDLKKFDNLMLVNPINISEIYDDSLINYIDIDLQAKPICYFLNIKSYKVIRAIQFTIPKDIYNDSVYLNQNLKWNYRDKKFYGVIRTSHPNKQFNYAQLVIFDNDGNLISKIFCLDSIYNKYNIANYYNVVYSFSDKSKYYAAVSNCKNIYQIDNGKIVDKISYITDSNFRIINYSFPLEMAIDDWFKANSSISNITMFNIYNDNLKLAFYNSNYKVMGGNPLDRDNLIFSNFLLIYNIKTKLYKVIKFENYTKTFELLDDKIYSLSYSKNGSKITIYKLKK